MLELARFLLQQIIQKTIKKLLCSIFKLLNIPYAGKEVESPYQYWATLLYY